MKNVIITSFIAIFLSFFMTFISCDQTAEDEEPENLNPAAPVLSSPGHNSKDVKVDVTLSWQASLDPDGDKVKYNVFLDTNTSPGQAASMGQTTTTFNIILNANTTYYWKVEADDGNNGKASSGIWSFTTINNAPEAFNLIFPSISQDCVPLESKLVWGSSSDSDGEEISYDVYLGTDQPPTNIVSASQSDTIFQLSLAERTTYYWKVIAKNESGQTKESAAWYFTSLKLPPEVDYGSLIDSRDNTVYNTILIDGYTWMAENLAYLPEVHAPADASETDPRYYVYEYDGSSIQDAIATDNFQEYGVLYNLPAVLNGAGSSSTNPSGVQGVCPSGWHVPSRAEWDELGSFLIDSGHDEPALAIKAICAWYDGGDGDDIYGMSFLPGGSKTPNFTQIGLRGYWWTSSDWYKIMEYTNNYIGYGGIAHPNYAMSVRCKKD